MSAINRGSVSLALNNGTGPTNGYIAGRTLVLLQGANWFEFTIPTLNQTVFTSATLLLDQPSNGHAGGTGTYSLFVLGARPFSYLQVLLGDFLLTTNTTSATNGTTISINLTPYLLPYLDAAQGGSLFIGGFDAFGGIAGGIDFRNTNTASARSRLLVTVAPEIDPSSAMGALTLLLGSAATLRARRRPARA